jgi:hypothetical protein
VLAHRASKHLPLKFIFYPGYPASQRIRKRVEEIFAWIKTVGGQRRTRHRGVKRVGWMFTLALTACNLVRMRSLLPAPA